MHHVVPQVSAHSSSASSPSVSTNRRKSAATVRHGHTLIHVHDVKDVATVLSSLPSFSPPALGSELGSIAECHRKVLEAISASSGTPCSTMAIALGRSRPWLPCSLRNRLRKLDGAYAYLRHCSSTSLAALIEEVIDVSASSSCSSPSMCDGARIGNDFVAVNLDDDSDGSHAGSLGSQSDVRAKLDQILGGLALRLPHTSADAVAAHVSDGAQSSDNVAHTDSRSTSWALKEKAHEVDGSQSSSVQSSDCSQSSSVQSSDCVLSSSVQSSDGVQSSSVQSSDGVQSSNVQSSNVQSSDGLQSSRVQSSNVQSSNVQSSDGVQSSNVQSSDGVQSSKVQSSDGVQPSIVQSSWVLKEKTHEASAEDVSHCILCHGRCAKARLRKQCYHSAWKGAHCMRCHSRQDCTASIAS